MTTLTLTDFEADLIAAVRALPEPRRAAVLDGARAGAPRAAASPPPADTPGGGEPLGSRPHGDPAAEAAWDARYVAEERKEMRAWAVEQGMSEEEAEEFAEDWTDDAPGPTKPVSGAELVAHLGGILGDEAADELQEIIERECGQIEWGSWDLPPGHQRPGGADAGQPGGDGACGGSG